MKTTKFIKKERKNMTDKKRVQRALVKCAGVFEEEKLNMSEGLKVFEEAIVNTFENAIENVSNIEEFHATCNIAEEYLTSLAQKVANKIKNCKI